MNLDRLNFRFSDNARQKLWQKLGNPAGLNTTTVNKDSYEKVMKYLRIAHEGEKL